MAKNRNNFYSPLRYPGGKTKLAPFIQAMFYENNLVGYDYIEPFSGGAGVALSLLFEEYVSTVTINDYDRSIYAFWDSAVHHGERFCEEIANVQIDVDMWLRQRSIQKQKDTVDLFELGFSTFFLNRVNVSGVIKGGVIGGLKQKGKYKMDARFNKKDLVKKIKKISLYKNRIEVKNKDAMELLQGDLTGKFVYLDPPYVKKAKNLYMNFYNEENHSDIADFLLSKQNNFYWLLSYDQDDLINKLYRGCKNKINWNVGYGSSNRKGHEFIFACKSLNLDTSRKVIAA